jgi:hypothetical protein
MADPAAASKQNLAELRAAGEAVPVILERAATEVAKAVRADAARHGHHVGIRVVRKTTGVRVTITGPQAARYRRPVQDALEARVPDVQAQIRVMTTRRA